MSHETHTVDTSTDTTRRGFRLAAYAVCVKNGRVLLARHASGTWSLPGGGVEHAEDPFHAVIREVAEETGHVDPVPIGGLIEH
ncbi:NUDIX domain-containing protein [Saccharomonospora sp. NB11]|jgi:8-oxo-dGTP diphosphatase|uniref:NUDIX hydrolase n=1 Tax=Saccharomonospora sp. NB11 TaxID=1642298 RepID=UPI0027DD2300|nr:NUDIX domain-containing protein [Saccharomonospora sp. NB11]